MKIAIGCAVVILSQLIIAETKLNFLNEKKRKNCRQMNHTESILTVNDERYKRIERIIPASGVSKFSPETLQYVSTEEIRYCNFPSEDLEVADSLRILRQNRFLSA
jgi:hypothetical protein